MPSCEPRPYRRAPLLLLLTLTVPGCAGTADRPEGIRLSDEEKEEIRATEGTDPGTSSRIEDRSLLFVTLDRNLKTWNDAIAAKTSDNERLVENLRTIITRTVYWNFDAILDELRDGTDSYTRIIAAAALGFSRTLPSPGRPDRSTEAIEPLLSVLDQGNDRVTANAVMSLGQIADASVPKETIIDLMLRHHDPEVRANAAYACARLVRPKDSDLWLNALIASLDDPEPKVRVHVTTALGALGRREAASSLVRKLGDDLPLVQAGAARAIGKLGYTEFAIYLLDKLTSPVRAVRDYTHEALRTLSGEDFGPRPQDWQAWCSAHAAADDGEDSPSTDPQDTAGGEG